MVMVTVTVVAVMFVVFLVFLRVLVVLVMLVVFRMPVLAGVVAMMVRALVIVVVIISATVVGDIETDTSVGTYGYIAVVVGDAEECARTVGLCDGKHRAQHYPDGHQYENNGLFHNFQCFD